MVNCNFQSETSWNLLLASGESTCSFNFNWCKWTAQISGLLSSFTLHDSIIAYIYILNSKYWFMFHVTWHQNDFTRTDLVMPFRLWVWSKKKGFSYVYLIIKALQAIQFFIIFKGLYKYYGNSVKRFIFKYILP